MTVYYVGKEKFLTQIITMTPPPDTINVKWNIIPILQNYIQCILCSLVVPLVFSTKISMHYEQYV